MGNDLDVGANVEIVTRLAHEGSQLPMIVNLAVADHENRVSPVADGLRFRSFKERESRVSQCELAIRAEPAGLAFRSAMCERIDHGGNDTLLALSAAPVPFAGNAAHRRQTLIKRTEVSLRAFFYRG